MIKEGYDVIIAGGGPAGSCTAKFLAENDIDVAVFEKRPSIGSEKRCAEGLSLNTMNIIEEKMGKIPDRCIAQMIDGAIVYSPDGSEVNIDFKENTGAVLERKVYDKWLAAIASRKGAYIQAKTDVVDILKDKGNVGGVKIETGGEESEIRSNIVVGADGVESTIARKAGLNTTHALQNIDSGFQYEMSNLDLRDPSKIELRFGNDIAPRGYLWIFPKGDDIANVGIGVANTDRPAKYYVDAFIKENPAIFSGASIIEVNAGGIPVGGLLDNMVLDGFLAVGDAAHQVNPIHGGGLKEAVLGGEIASDVIIGAFEKQDFSKESLSAYNSIWWKERGNSLKRVESLKNVFERLSDDELNNLAHKLTGEDLIEFSRGNHLFKLGKILMKNPSLANIARKLL